jgi:hypothetical protein
LVRDRTVDLAGETANAHAPIEFKPGSLGAGLPYRSLLVSPRHRMLMLDQQGHEVLAPAIGLVGRPKVRSKQGMKRVQYVHVLLDHHAILMADGVAAESLYASDEVIRGLPVKDRATVDAHYPLDAPLPQPARRMLTVAETRFARDWQLRPKGAVLKVA